MATIEQCPGLAPASRKCAERAAEKEQTWDNVAADRGSRPFGDANGLVVVLFQLFGANDGSDSSRVLLAASEQQPSLL